MSYGYRTQMQPFKFEVGQEVIFVFNGQPRAGVIRERRANHEGDNIYAIRVGHDLTRTVLERNIQDSARPANSVAPGPFHGEIFEKPPEGEMHIRSQDILGSEFHGWA